MINQPSHQIICDGLKELKKGKVRHVYELKEGLLVVASDRVSAFDAILPSAIPDKGKILTQVSEFWFNNTQHIVPNHLISCDWSEFPEEVQPFHTELKDRSMWAKKAKPFPVECVVRGYLMGSGWKEYQRSQTVSGVPLPANLKQGSKFDNPIFTPATKAEDGHDENISFEEMVALVGQSAADTLRTLSIELYQFGATHCDAKGIILADTKFEFGLCDNEIILIDEVMTPDSSRFWHHNDYQEGISPPSYDKQIIRDYLETTDWDKQPPAPPLPDDIITKASKRYNDLKKMVVQ